MASGLLTEASQESLAIRILADQLLALTAHGVHCSDDACLGGEIIEQRNHRHLVGNGEIQAAETEGARPPDGIFERVGRNFDGQIAPVQASGNKGGFLHHTRWIFGHGHTKQSYQFSPVTHCACPRGWLRFKFAASSAHLRRI
jgi:hypothetical protein